MTSNLRFQINGIYACSSLKFDSVLGTEPASENGIRTYCDSTPGIRFYCKLVTLVRCREIRRENRFSGRVGGKWLCEMTSAFIIKELRGARALRLFSGRSAFPPPEEKKGDSSNQEPPLFFHQVDQQKPSYRKPTVLNFSTFPITACTFTALYECSIRTSKCLSVSRAFNSGSH